MYYLYKVDKLPEVTAVKQGTDIIMTLRNTDGLVIEYPESIHTNFIFVLAERLTQEVPYGYWLKKQNNFCKS